MVFQKIPVYGNCTPLNKCQRKTIPPFPIRNSKMYPPLENALVIVINVAKHFKNDENVLGSKVIKEIQRNVIAVHDHGHYYLKKYIPP